ncbi:MAG: hypothetical protein Q4B63_08050 [Clostridium perfringens]|nr:hypothetical protein [Clostridium perfringens]
MNDFLKYLNESGILPFISTIASLLISLVSIFIAGKSLKLTTQSIQNANRPYVVAYSNFIQAADKRLTYLIIKNFGKSAAIIDSIEYSTTEFYTNENEPFLNLKKCSIAPNQFYSSRVFYSKPRINFSVTITYHDNNMKPYKETYEINTEAILQQVTSFNTSSNQSELEKTLSRTAQELVRHNF